MNNELQQPTTAVEEAELLDAIPEHNPLRLVLRRILWHRDVLKSEFDALYAELETHRANAQRWRKIKPLFYRVDAGKNAPYDAETVTLWVPSRGIEGETPEAAVDALADQQEAPDA